jgi:hypothetical protein
MKDRRLRQLPRSKKSRTLKEDPSRDIPKTES